MSRSPWIIALVVLFSAQDISAQPSVTGVSGTVSHAGSITITGSAFGTKATAAPYKWEDANGTNGDRLESRGWLVADQLQEPDLSTAVLRGTPSETTVIRLRHGMSGGSDDVGLFGFGRDSEGAYVGLTAESAVNETAEDLPTTLYIDYWMRMTEAVASTADNFKILRHHRYTGSDNGGLGFVSGSSAAPLQHFGSSEGSWQGISGGWDTEIALGDLDDTWVHLQFVTRWTSPDGMAIIYVDGVRASNLTGRNFTSRANWFFETQGLNDTGNPGQYLVYFDDIYIDTSFARVEICAGASYSSKGHCEIQRPSAWNATSITATVYRGTFGATDAAYVYVCDSDNSCDSSGYAVTFGDDPGGGASAPVRIRIRPDVASVCVLPIAWMVRRLRREDQ